MFSSRLHFSPEDQTYMPTMCLTDISKKTFTLISFQSCFFLRFPSLIYLPSGTPCEHEALVWQVLGPLVKVFISGGYLVKQGGTSSSPPRPSLQPSGCVPPGAANLNITLNEIKHLVYTSETGKVGVHVACHYQDQ